MNVGDHNNVPLVGIGDRVIVGDHIDVSLDVSIGDCICGVGGLGGVCGSGVVATDGVGGVCSSAVSESEN